MRRQHDNSHPQMRRRYFLICPGPLQVRSVRVSLMFGTSAEQKQFASQIAGWLPSVGYKNVTPSLDLSAQIVGHDSDDLFIGNGKGDSARDWTIFVGKGER